MHPDGSPLPPSWGSLLALLLWLSLFGFLLTVPSRAHGQTQSERLASIERELISSLATCGKLSDALKAQSAKLESLSADLAALRESLGISARRIDDLESELRDSRQLSMDLQAEVLRLRGLLQTSQERLAGLSQNFEDYKRAREAVEQGLNRQLRAWKVGAVAASVLAVVATVLAIAK